MTAFGRRFSTYLCKNEISYLVWSTYPPQQWRHGTAPCYGPTSIKGSHCCSVGSTFHLSFPF